MTKAELAEKIKRRLGCPMVNVELDTSQIFDAIDYARDKWIKWAVGQATQEVYFTMALSAGQYLYDLPAGVVEVVDYEAEGAGSINTLFTIENYLYTQGLYDPLISTKGYWYGPGGTGSHTWGTYGYNRYNLLSYHIARDFIENVRKYTVDMFNYKYHPYTNQLEIRPTPTVNDLNQLSTLFILIRAYMIEESMIEDDWDRDATYKSFYEYSDWIFDYATAYCKVILGTIRRKFANFTSIGNTGIALDGDILSSEGKEEMERLEEKVKLEEAFDGYGITMG